MSVPTWYRHDWICHLKEIHLVTYLLSLKMTFRDRHLQRALPALPLYCHMWYCRQLKDTNLWADLWHDDVLLGVSILASGLCSFRNSVGGHIGGTAKPWGQYVSSWSQDGNFEILWRMKVGKCQIIITMPEWLRDIICNILFHILCFILFDNNIGFKIWFKITNNHKTYIHTFLSRCK